MSKKPSIKFSEPSEYFGVTKHTFQKGNVKYSAKIQRKAFCGTSYHDTEREAAKWVDLKLIEHGYEPVNILKRK